MPTPLRFATLCGMTGGLTPPWIAKNEKFAASIAPPFAYVDLYVLRIICWAGWRA